MHNQAPLAGVTFLWRGAILSPFVPCIRGRNYYLKSMNAIVSEKGQVTIPKKLRDKLGLRTGSVLQFSDENGILLARKFQQEDPIRKWRGRGIIPGGLSVDDYLKQTRDAHVR
ncbi:MAG: AbrB/MazE/SpoVT family DNA-binding domain-containing protein [Puniceicoccaceae bacterium]|nr:MAG: AbrB/MazE/SpoVT family DNA-binding domain-containing protein [Puniceicoccaceae bacterium]